MANQRIAAGGLGITMDDHGTINATYAALAEVVALVKKMGSEITGVALHGKKREDGRHTNAQVAQYLVDGGRDFFDGDEKIAGDVAETIAREIQTEMDKAVVRAKRKALRAGGMRATKGAVAAMKAPKLDQKKVNQAVGKAWKRGMEQYIEYIRRRILDGVTVDGTVKELSEEYAKQKMRELGFTHPIGTASGQLLDNLDSTNTGNIRLKKG